MEEFIEKQKDEVRLTGGIGLAFRLGQMARLEINYCVPTWFKDSDTLINGIQFGVGVDFL